VAFTIAALAYRSPTSDGRIEKKPRPGARPASIVRRLRRFPEVPCHRGRERLPQLSEEWARERAHLDLTSRLRGAAELHIEFWMPVDTSKDRFTVAVGVDNEEAARQALSDQLTDWTYA